MAVTVPAVTALGMANPYHHRSVCGEENGWLAAVYRALADTAQALPSYLLHYLYYSPLISAMSLFIEMCNASA